MVIVSFHKTNNPLHTSPQRLQHSLCLCPYGKVNQPASTKHPHTAIEVATITESANYNSLTKSNSVNMLGQDLPPVPRTTATNARFSYHADSFDSVSSSSGAKTTSSTTARKRVTQHSFPSSGTQQQQTYSKPQKQPTGGDHTRHRSASFASTAATTSKLLPSPETVLAKEKEFMANTRILAMSSLIDSFASSSHSKQGFYGKQLKIIGTVNPCSSSSSSTATSPTGSELDVTVKVIRMMPRLL